VLVVRSALRLADESGTSLSDCGQATEGNRHFIPPARIPAVQA
jgi:hypothetical protein